MAPIPRAKALKERLESPVPQALVIPRAPPRMVLFFDFGCNCNVDVRGFFFETNSAELAREAEHYAARGPPSRPAGGTVRR